jgi:hypothetical protein
MATLTMAIGDDVIMRALDSVEVQPTAVTGAGHLHAASLDAFQAATVEAWGRLRSLVETCARLGTAQVSGQMDEFLQYVGATASELGVRADEFRTWVNTKIRSLITATFDFLVGALRAELIVGTRRYVLESLDLQQKVVYSNSLKASLTELCQFTGGGELVLSGAYKLQQS